MNPRDLWRPQRQELPQSCATCPFKPGSNFSTIVEKLCRVAGEKFSQRKVTSARIALMMETEKAGDFICHGTVYNSDEQMTPRPASEHRQCPGASAWFRRNGAKR